MTATARLLDQRSQGYVRLRMEQRGVAVLQEAGCCKVRLPFGSDEAILINVSGGLAGGDVVGVSAEVGKSATLRLTTQAAERVYRTIGPAAEVSISLRVAAGSTLFWLPQETILFEGSALSRKLDVELGEKATFLAVESMVFGRRESGEIVRHVDVNDRWHVRQGGRLAHAEAFKLGPEWPISKARLGESQAIATLLMVSPQADALLDRLRAVLGQLDGASAWNGKLVARFLASDGYTLRKTLIQALGVCLGEKGVPKCWTF
jgi:urease accessory protein